MRKIIFIAVMLIAFSASAQSKKSIVQFGIYEIEFTYDSTAKSNAKGIPASIEVYKQFGGGGMIGRQVRGFYKKSFTDVELLKFVDKAHTDHKDKRLKGE